MKKRVVSLLLALVMLTSLVPTTVWAEDAYSVAPDTEMQDIRQERDNEGEQEDDPALAGRPMLSTVMPAAVTLAGSGTKDDPYRITSAEDFAEMPSSNSGKYFKLTEGIEVNAPYANEFRGNFDGDGHTIAFNYTGTSNGNVGLFSTTNGATIENTTVAAQIKVSVGGSYGAAGLVGKIGGTTTIKNCGVYGKIENTVTGKQSNVGGIVGYINSKTTIENCYSAAEISVSNSRDTAFTGGIAGYSYDTLNVTNSYVCGTISNTTGKGATSGFVGDLKTNYNYKANFTNCYIAATVSSGGYAAAFLDGSYVTFTNCYYDSTVADGKSVTNTSNEMAGLTPATTDKLKGLALTLGDAFQDDKTSLNGGYPILTWQYNDPTATPTVIVTVMPADAKLIWDDVEQTGGANGVYTLTKQKQGAHTYTVSHEAGDYAAQTGTITVKSSDMTKTFTLALNRHKLTFTGLPADAELIVKSGTDTLKAESDGSYAVTNGIYSYTVTKFGYVDAEGTVTVNRADAVQPITMTRAPSATVRFTYAEDAAPTIKVAYAKSAWNNKVTMSAEADGSYLLPVDYKYEWTFDSAKYISQSGEIDLKGAEAGSEKSIEIPMSLKPAGSGTKDDPYLIADASQLRWFAAQVNDNSKSTICAQLTDDIDLKGKEWTPIGRNYSYAYKGTFDGQKHTVSGLFISGSASQNCGLFGYVEKGTVKDLTVKGTITLTGGGSSSYGAGGIVGQLSGTEGSVRNCRSDVAITGGQNVGGIVGYVSSEYSTATKSITGCVNTGRITSNSNNAGGIVGYISGQVTVDSCYNRGTVAGGGWRAGGITAYLSSSYAAVRNCYTTGAVKGSDSAAVVGKKSSGSVSDCYYLNTLGTDSNATAKTSDELKALAPTLGEPFMTDPAGVNDGYPIFAWQVPTYAVTFRTGAAGASVTVNGVSGQADADGKYTVKLPDGAYEYTVSAFGYQAAAGQVTVNGTEQTVTVTLTAVEQRTVRFNVTPAEAKASVTVTWDGDGHTVAAQSDGSYLLPEGAYTYTVKAKGYARVVEPLNVAKDETISVTLTPSTAWDGAERDQPGGSGTQTDPYQIGSGAELAWLANAVNNASGGTKFYVVLTDDIDLGNQPWTPIGKDFYEFSGVFDGKGHVVEGLKVSNAADAGLFGVAKGAAIKNLVVRGSVTGTDNAAGILAKAKNEACTIENCGNEAAVTVAKSGGGYAGGILGSTSANVQIARCYNSGIVTSTGNNSYSRAGGIVGRIFGSDGKAEVNTCYNTGNITSDSYAAAFSPAMAVLA